MANQLIFIQIFGAQGWAWDGFCVEKIHEKLLLVNLNMHRRSEVAQGEKSRWFEPNSANLI